MKNNLSIKTQKIIKEKFHITDSAKKLFKLMVNSQSTTLKFKNFKINNLNKVKNKLSEEVKNDCQKKSNVYQRNSERFLSVRLSNKKYSLSKTDNKKSKFRINRNNYFREENSFNRQLKLYKYLYSNRFTNQIHSNEKNSNDDNINIIKNYYFDRKIENKERLNYFNTKTKLINQKENIISDRYDKREEQYNKLLFPKNNYSISRRFNRDKLTQGMHDKSANVKDNGKKIKYKITGIFKTDTNQTENSDFGNKV